MYFKIIKYYLIKKFDFFCEENFKIDRIDVDMTSITVYFEPGYKYKSTTILQGDFDYEILKKEYICSTRLKKLNTL
ncbi:hypothetical protein M0Q50_08910 [bacterium]|jgi:hypothetical protein|nr:hypothetical protein [bacterium]